MSFFPNNIMPLTPKQNVIGSKNQSDPSKITAEDFNKHDEEIVAIQKYLFSTSKTITTGSVSASSAIESEAISLMDKIVDLERRTNNLLGPAGFGCISGYIHAGQRITLPEGMHATYLTKAVVGTSVEVASTTGFPSDGILTIFNKLAIGGEQGTFVEYISYSGTTETSFLNCQRGVLDTTISDHAAPSTFVQGTANTRQSCAAVPPFMETCVRNYQGWRHLTWYQLYGLKGSYVDVVDSLLKAASYPDTIFKDYSGAASRNDFYAIADKQGMLGTNQDGTYYLKSSVGGAFSWADSTTLLNECQKVNLVSITEPLKFEWPMGAVPVLSGKVNLSISPVMIYNDIVSNSSGKDDVGYYLDTDGTIQYSSERYETKGAIFTYMCFGIGLNGIVKHKEVLSIPPSVQLPEYIYYGLQFQNEVDFTVNVVGEAPLSSSLVKTPSGLTPSPSEANPTSITGTLEEKGTTYIKVKAENPSGIDYKTAVLVTIYVPPDDLIPTPKTGPSKIKFPTQNSIIIMHRHWYYYIYHHLFNLHHYNEPIGHTIEVDGAYPMTLTVSSLPTGFRLTDDVNNPADMEAILGIYHNWWYYWVQWYSQQPRTITLTDPSKKPGILGIPLWYHYHYQTRLTATNAYGTDSVVYSYRHHYWYDYYLGITGSHDQMVIINGEYFKYDRNGQLVYY